MNSNIKIKISTIEYSELLIFCIQNKPVIFDESHIEDIAFCEASNKIERLFFKFKSIKNHKKLYTIDFTMSQMLAIYNRLKHLSINNQLLLILGKIDKAWKNKIMAVQYTAL